MKYLVLMIIGCSFAQAQWTPMGIPSGGEVSVYWSSGDTLAYSISLGKLYRQGADTVWKLVVPISDKEVGSLSVCGDTIALMSPVNFSTYEQTVWVSEDAAMSWREILLPPRKEYSLSSNHPSIVRVGRCSDQTYVVEVMNLITGNIESREYDCSGEVGRSYASVWEGEVVRCPTNADTTTGGYRNEHIKHATDASATWEYNVYTSSFRPIGVGRFGFGIWHGDTLVAINSDTSDSFVFPASFMREIDRQNSSIRVDDRDLYCQRYNDTAIWVNFDNE